MSIPSTILQRTLVAIPTLLIISMLGFTLMRFQFSIGPVLLPIGPNAQWVTVIEKQTFKNPIDPLASLKYNPQISKAALEAEEKRLGLDQPLWIQYTRWLSHLLQFQDGFFKPDLGKTHEGEDVAWILATRAGNSLMLNVLSMMLTWLIALPLGIFAALRWRSHLDRALTAFSAIGMAMPSFVMALLLAVFAVKTGWFPLGGLRSEGYAQFPWWQQLLDVLWHLALPTFILTVLSIASLQRQMRGNLLDVLQAEYVRAARARGLPENVVIYKHAVRTAINPLVTLLGFELAGLLSGSVLVEIVLGYPGLGVLIYSAVQKADTNLVMASLLMSSVMLVFGNLMADILLTLVDPRIELEN
ncbi:MAG: ABC transporter permease [Cyanobacteria bacterium]|nr:ABC transporter permease [Cyanobacteriota bacterium]